MNRLASTHAHLQPWLLFAGVGFLSILVYYALPPALAAIGDGADPAIPQAFLYDSFAGLSAVAILAGVAINRPARKLPWLLLAGGQLLFTLGDVIWDIEQLGLGQDPFPSIADVAYLGAYPLFVAAIGLFVRRRLPRQRWQWLVDLGIVAGALSLVLWLLMVEPILKSPDYTPIARLIALAYPIADIGLLAVIVSASLSPRPTTLPGMLLGTGVLVLLGADVAFASFPGLQDATGQWVDALYLAPYVLWGAAALHPAMGEASRDVITDRLLTVRRLTVLAAAALLPPVLIAARQLFGLDADISAIGAAWVGLTVLVLLDVLGLLREQQEALERRKALEAELFEARKLESVGRLAGGIAHDFNNILTAIIGFSDLAIAEAPRADVESVRQIRDSAQRAAALVQKLLAFSRKQMLQPRVIDLRIAIRDTEPVLRQLLGEHVSLTLDLPARPVAVVADPTQLDQVLLNLSLNARDAMPAGGRLTLSVRREEIGAANRRWAEMPDGPFAVLAVKDTGSGMDAMTLAHIFEPFFTTKEMGKGTGLGLATTYGIVRQSNGFIDVHSELNVGTEFELFFPLAQGPVAEAPVADSGAETVATVEDGQLSVPLAVEQPAAEEPLLAADERVIPADELRLAADDRASSDAEILLGTGDAPVQARTRRPAHVLVVEDEPAVRELASRVLRDAGYDVVAAPGPVAAVETLYADSRIDLLLSDVVMPAMSGYELARQVRTLIRPDLPVVLMSGYSETMPHQSDISIGFLPKPFTPNSLLAAVAESLP